MAEFASNGKGNLGVTLGAIGTGLGIIGNGMSAFNPCGTHYNDAGMTNLLIENASLKADVYTDSKLADVYERLERMILNLERSVASSNAAQGVVNAQVGANIAVAQNDIREIKGELGELTRTIIPITSVCPEPMPRYNSYTPPNA